MSRSIVKREGGGVRGGGGEGRNLVGSNFGFPAPLLNGFTCKPLVLILR